MKITIVNQHTNNFGDEAAGISLIQELNSRYNNPEINIIYNGDGKIHYEKSNINHKIDCKLKNMGYFNIIMKMIFHNYKGNKTMKDFDNTIKDSDYIFVAPCGANIGIYKDWRFLIRILFVIFNKKCPIFYLNTIGESGNYIFDKIALYILKHSKIYVREKKSFNYLKSKKLNCKLGIDTAFLFKLENKNKQVYNNKKITFVLSDISKHKNFKRIDTNRIIKEIIIPNLYNFALTNDFEIHILPHLNTEEELNLINNIIQEFKLRYKFENIVKDNIKDVFDYYNAIASSKLVIGMRYHAIILAAKANIPFITLAYENKMVESSNYTRMNEFCIKLYDEFDEKEYINMMHKSIEKHTEIVEKLKKVNQEIQHLAKIPLEEVEEDVE